MIKAFYLSGSELHHILTYLFYCLRLVVFGLGVKLIGETDDLLLGTDRQHVAVRDGKAVFDDVSYVEAHARVPFAHQPVPGEALVLHQAVTQVAMADVGLFAETFQLGRVGKVDAYVVEHGGFVYEIEVGVHLRMVAGNLQRLFCYDFAMGKENMVTLASFLIIFLNNFQRIHLHGNCYMKYKIKNNIFVVKALKKIKMERLAIILLGAFVWSQSIAGVRVGAERMEELLPLLGGQRVALVVNQTSVVGEGMTHLLDTLHRLNVDVRCVFAPEHGFRGDEDAGKIISDSKDQRTGVPVVSIYGKSKKPSREQLSGVDVVVFDIQDVGARFYTYISAMHYVMEACAEYGKKMIVCDRPNPNDYVDGPVLKEEFKSYVGMHPIPVVHGLTVGELARMINGEGWLKSSGGERLTCDLTVVKAQGWQRGQFYHLPVKPSPNLPNDLSVSLYPSLCFFEATRVSMGRGTTFPFQTLGAPDKRFGAFTFTPRSLAGWDTQPLHLGKTCYGIDLRGEDAHNKAFTLKYFLDFFRLSGNDSAFISRPEWFDKLAGTDQLRLQIVAGKDEKSIRSSWEKDLKAYEEMRRRYLIY